MFYLLRWLIGFAEILEGFCIIISLGFWYPNLTLWADGKLLDYMEEQNRKNRRKHDAN